MVVRLRILCWLYVLRFALLVGTSMSCPSCGADHKRSKNGPCPACYRRSYRKTESGRKAIRNADKKSIQKHPDRRFQEVVRYREKTGYYVPLDLLELNVAVKRLDATVEAAENGSRVRQPSERRSQQSAERRDRFRRSTDVLRLGASGGAERVE